MSERTQTFVLYYAVVLLVTVLTWQVHWALGLYFGYALHRIHPDAARASTPKNDPADDAATPKNGD